MMRRLSGQLGVHEETENPHPVIEIDDDNALFGQILAIVNAHVAGARSKCTAVYIYVNRKMVLAGLRRSPDIQIQAVFTYIVDQHEFLGPGKKFMHWLLHAIFGEMIGM